MHKCGYIHRDLKPANIMMGEGRKSNIVYLIDFGLTKKAIENNMPQINYNKFGSKKMAGTPIYASISAHMAG